MVYLYTCLFNDDVCSSDYTMSSERVTNEERNGKDTEGSGRNLVHA